MEMPLKIVMGYRSLILEAGRGTAFKAAVGGI
jgi:hypothetical protein